MPSLSRASVAAVLGCVLALAACSTDPIAADPAEGADPADTITVSSEFGEVEIPAEPQRALGMYTTDVDILIALGFPLADSQPIRGDGWTTFPAFFPKEPLEGVTPFANYPDYNYEQILAAAPDFILNGLGYDKKVNRRLPEIAPTYSDNAFDGRSWLEHFEETAEALDRTEEYQAWVDTYDARVAELRSALEDKYGDELADVVVAPFGYWEGKVNSSCYSGVECQAFRDLGLTIFKGAEAKNGQGVGLSEEQLGQLSDVDYAFAIQIPSDQGKREFDNTVATLEENQLWGGLDFVQEDHLVPYDMEITYGSPSGQMAFLDVIEEAML